MKRTLILLLAVLTLVPGALCQQEPKKKVAVYLANKEADEEYATVIMSKMVEKITRDPQYMAMERTADFLSALKAEENYSVSGEVRESQIAEIGQKLGVKYVVAVKITELKKYDQVYVDARMINVETSENMGSVNESGSFDTFANLVDVAEKISDKLLAATSTGGVSQAGYTGAMTTSGGAVEKFNVKGVPFEMVRIDGYFSPYYIGRTEVTQALWMAVMGENPSNFRGPTLPVEMVSWNDCMEFIDRLNRLTGRNFRLPTEDEWVFAAQGGTRSHGYTYSGSDNLSSVGWYKGNSGERTHPVATKLDNELGLFDMSGNVWEWTSSEGPDGRVYRGGSWYRSADQCRVSYRSSNSPSGRGSGIGLRLAL